MADNNEKKVDLDRKNRENWVNGVHPSLMRFHEKRHIPAHTKADGTEEEARDFQVTQVTVRDEKGATFFVDVKPFNVSVNRPKVKEKEATAEAAPVEAEVAEAAPAEAEAVGVEAAPAEAEAAGVEATEGGEKKQRPSSYSVYFPPKQKVYNIRRFPSDSEKDAEGKYTPEAVAELPEGTVVGQKGNIAYVKMSREDVMSNLERTTRDMLTYFKEKRAEAAKEAEGEGKVRTDVEIDVAEPVATPEQEALPEI